MAIHEGFGYKCSIRTYLRRFRNKYYDIARKKNGQSEIKKHLSTSGQGCKCQFYFLGLLRQVYYPFDISDTSNLKIVCI